MPVLEFFQRIVAFFLLIFGAGFVVIGSFSLFHAVVALPFIIGAVKIARYPFVNRYNNGLWVW